VAQTVTIGEQKVFPESESLKFSTTPTPQVENSSDSDSSTPTSQPWLQHTRSLTSTNLHARDSHQRPSRLSHTPVGLSDGRYFTGLTDILMLI